MNQSCSVASSLNPLHRQQLAVKVLSKQEPISHLAKQKQVSRKFLYQQKAIAKDALNQAFEKEKPEQEVLYYLPITQKWIFQLMKSVDSHLSLLKYEELRSYCEIYLTIQLVLVQFIIELSKQLKKPEISIKIKIYLQLK